MGGVQRNRDLCRGAWQIVWRNYTLLNCVSNANDRLFGLVVICIDTKLMSQYPTDEALCNLQRFGMKLQMSKQKEENIHAFRWL